MERINKIDKLLVTCLWLSARRLQGKGQKSEREDEWINQYRWLKWGRMPVQLPVAQLKSNFLWWGLALLNSTRFSGNRLSQGETGGGEERTPVRWRQTKWDYIWMMFLGNEAKRGFTSLLLGGKYIERGIALFLICACLFLFGKRRKMWWNEVKSRQF